MFNIGTPEKPKYILDFNHVLGTNYSQAIGRKGLIYRIIHDDIHKPFLSLGYKSTDPQMHIINPRNNNEPLPITMKMCWDKCPIYGSTEHRAINKNLASRIMILEAYANRQDSILHG